MALELTGLLMNEGLVCTDLFIYFCWFPDNRTIYLHLTVHMVKYSM